MVRTTDIHSLTDFQRNARAYIEQVNQTKNPIAITVNGGAKVVVLDAEEYQEMVDVWEKQRFIAAIREGEADIVEGRFRPADEVFEDILNELKEKYGV